MSATMRSISVDPTGMKGNKCDPEVYICVSDGTNPPLEWPSFDWSRIIDISFNIADLGVDSGDPIVVTGEKPAKQGPPDCRGYGPRVSLGVALGGTLFGAPGFLKGVEAPS